MPETKCGACGEPNQCGVAAGKGSCWCFTLPAGAKENAQQLREATGREDTCFCSACMNAPEPALRLKVLLAKARPER